MHSITLRLVILSLVASIIHLSDGINRGGAAIERANKMLVFKTQSPDLFENVEVAKQIAEEMASEGLSRDPAYKILKGFAAQKELARALGSADELDCSESRWHDLVSLRKQAISDSSKHLFEDDTCLQLRLCALVRDLSHTVFYKCNFIYTSKIRRATRMDAKLFLDFFMDFLNFDDQKHSIASVLKGEHKKNLQDPDIWAAAFKRVELWSGNSSYFNGDEKKRPSLTKEQLEEMRNTLTNNACDEIDSNTELRQLFDLSLSSARDLNPNPLERGRAKGETIHFPLSNRFMLKKVAAYEICKDSRNVDMASISSGIIKAAKTA